MTLKNSREIQDISEACKMANAALWAAEPYMKAGVTTKEVDNAINKFIVKAGGIPSSLGYAGFPGSACISVNQQVIHGIPSHKTVIKDGDIVSVDVTVLYNGFNGDNAYTFMVGDVCDETKQLLTVTQECLVRGIAAAKQGNRIGDISHAIQEYAESFGYGVVRKFVGHGIGREMHEEPEVPNFGSTGRGVRLVKGMTICIEPMINLVGHEVKTMSDGWTIEAASGSVSAHFEHTVVITDEGAKILTVRG